MVTRGVTLCRPRKSSALHWWVKPSHSHRAHTRQIFATLANTVLHDRPQRARRVRDSYAASPAVSHRCTPVRGLTPAFPAPGCPRRATAATRRNCLTEGGVTAGVADAAAGAP